MNNTEEISSIELIKLMTQLEKEIDLGIIMYNKVVRELYSRVPTIDNQKENKPKILTKTKIDL